MTSIASLKHMKQQVHLASIKINLISLYGAQLLGTGLKQHLQHPNLFTRSLYRYHFCYKVRRIMKQLGSPFPGELTYNKYDKIFTMIESLKNDFKNVNRTSQTKKESKILKS